MSAPGRVELHKPNALLHIVIKIKLRELHDVLLTKAQGMFSWESLSAAPRASVLCLCLLIIILINN